MRFLLLLPLTPLAITVALYLCGWLRCERRTAAWNARGRRLFGEDATWVFYLLNGRECAYRNGEFFAWLDEHATETTETERRDEQ